MNKNVIALAVAAAMAAPLAAQAEVKVSGQLQAEIVNWGGDVPTGLTMNDAQEGGTVNKGNFGALNFSASEDLGNGMKAIAKYSMNVDVEGRAPAQRDSYVGLNGNFGTVLMGTVSTPYKMATVKWDPFLATSGQARGNLGASTLHNGYAKNVIAYANKFGMAKVVAAVALDETNDDADADSIDNGHTGTFSVNMPVGPVEVAIAYLKAPSAGDDSSATKIGVKYTAGAIGVSLQHETVDAALMNNLSGGMAASDGETYTLLSGTYTMGANTFALNYGMNAQDYVGASIDNTNMTIGMVHSFSKSVRAHVAYTALDVDGGDVMTANGIAAGLRVKF